MAEDEGSSEKKDKSKEDKEKPEQKQEKQEDKDSDLVKAAESVRHTAHLKKRASSKAGMDSRLSLRKYNGDSFMSISNASSSSYIVKRPSSIEKMTKGPRFQNTYRLDSKKPFKAHEVYKILETIVMREVELFPHYDWSNGQRMVQAISCDARNAIRQMNYDRYKICVLVYAAEKKLQGFQAAFRALWDPERDGWSTFFYECRTYFISCTCFAVYHD